MLNIYYPDNYFNVPIVRIILKSLNIMLRYYTENPLDSVSGPQVYILLKNLTKNFRRYTISNLLPLNDHTMRGFYLVYLFC